MYDLITCYIVFACLLVLTATIGLLSNVQRQLAVVSADAEGGEKEVEYSNIWTPKKFQDADYWFLKTGEFYSLKHLFSALSYLEI
jgi:hypothetical protein